MSQSREQAFLQELQEQINKGTMTILHMVSMGITQNAFNDLMDAQTEKLNAILKKIEPYRVNQQQGNLSTPAEPAGNLMKTLKSLVNDADDNYAATMASGQKQNVIASAKAQLETTTKAVNSIETLLKLPESKRAEQFSNLDAKEKLAITLALQTVKKDLEKVVVDVVNQSKTQPDPGKSNPFEKIGPMIKEIQIIKQLEKSVAPQPESRPQNRMRS